MGIFPLHQQLQGVLLGLLLFEDRHLAEFIGTGQGEIVIFPVDYPWKGGRAVENKLTRNY